MKSICVYLRQFHPEECPSESFRGSGLRVDLLFSFASIRVHSRLPSRLFLRSLAAIPSPV
jgi:hypothetical protein